MEISELVPITLSRLPETFHHLSIRVHIERDGAGVTNEAEDPIGENQGSDDAGQRISPQSRTH
jgi:hypothetical protein